MDINKEFPEIEDMPKPVHPDEFNLEEWEKWFHKWFGGDNT